MKETGDRRQEAGGRRQERRSAGAQKIEKKNSFRIWNLRFPLI